METLGQYATYAIPVAVVVICFLLLRLHAWAKACHGWRDAYNDLKNKGSDGMGLEIATNGQLFKELRNRPNNHFILLIPRHIPDGMGVETHVCNIHTQDQAVAMLSVAAQTLSQGMPPGAPPEGFEPPDDFEPPTGPLWEDE